MSTVAFSPDGKYMITTGQDKIVHIWEVQTGGEVRQLVGHTDVIFTARFSPDGKTIATASQDNTARLWDVSTGQELRRFIGHAAGLENVVFSPDGKYLLTGSDDGTILLWDVDYHTTMQYLCSVLKRDFTDIGVAQSTPARLEGGAGVFSSEFILVKIFHQRKKTAESGSDPYEEKNKQKPWLRIEIGIKEIADPNPDGHGKAHFQADAAEPQKLLVRLFILHGAEEPLSFPLLR